MKKVDIEKVASDLSTALTESCQGMTLEEVKAFIVQAVRLALTPFLTVASAAAKGITPPAGVGIQYIGDRESHHDNLYGTNLTWSPGQVHNVPPAAAKKMLAHSDVYAEVEANGDEEFGDFTEDDKEPPDKLSPLLPNLDGMTKQDMQAYAQQHFGEKLHHAMSEDNMRAKIVNLIGERGLQS